MLPEELLVEATKLIKPKREDYSKAGLYQNFRQAEELADWVTRGDDKVYMTMVGIKLSRIASLMNSNKQPNNEALIDSFKDAINYLAIWGADRCQNKD
jgi:hypothetical protein